MPLSPKDFHSLLVPEDERKEYINSLLDFKMPSGERIDIFKLHAVLYIGNCDGNGEWNLTTNHKMFATSHLPIHVSDFDWCFEHSDDIDVSIKERFSELLRTTAEGHII